MHHFSPRTHPLEDDLHLKIVKKSKNSSSLGLVFTFWGFFWKSSNPLCDIRCPLMHCLSNQDRDLQKLSFYGELKLQLKYFLLCGSTVTPCFSLLQESNNHFVSLKVVTTIMKCILSNRITALQTDILASWGIQISWGLFKCLQIMFVLNHTRNS